MSSHLPTSVLRPPGRFWVACAALIGTSWLAVPSGAAEALPVTTFVNVLQGVLGDREPGAEINTEDMRRALDDSATLVLDARPRAEFAVSHLPGARAVGAKPGTPPSQYTPDVNDVIRLTPDRSRRLVVYCNGLHCGRSKRFAVELLKAGYTNVKRYQLGIPAWRALGGVTQVEKEALLSLRARDQSAVLVDAREPRADRKRIRDSVSISIGDASKAKDDGRLPMTDHNTRIFVVGSSGLQARAVAEAIVKAAFHNVAFFEGDVAVLGLD